MAINLTLVDQAIEAVVDPDFEDEDGYCQRWARQVRQAALGTRYDRYDCGTARESGLALSAAGYQVRSLEPGCLVYKLFKPSGHVGIYVGDVGSQHDLVAENSSTRIGRVRGAKGYRELGEWGEPELIIALPDPWAAKVVLPNGATLVGWGIDTILTPARAWGAALGLPVGWRTDLHLATIGGHLITAAPKVVDSVGWLPVRLLAQAAGLRVSWDQATRRVTVARG